ncbi:hypothetical protein CPB83DRAFT_858021 [Crepidotus variabilis]|uniref:Uncharacterized protein n=1 Tax=Crepidotus variabilis TaxID=179855 RepID=A0A9P6ECF2_9AGAR|nr:hypothetical protein CPB83DRAFT_858021 [Crepidotus variabilis]
MQGRALFPICALLCVSSALPFWVSSMKSGAKTTSRRSRSSFRVRCSFLFLFSLLWTGD